MLHGKPTKQPVLGHRRLLQVSAEATVPGRVPGFDRRRMAAAVFEYFPALTRIRGRAAGLLSGGERQMLAIGSALMCGPELLLVDELSLGLAPVVVEETP